jgi:hypothetical protein
MNDRQAVIVWSAILLDALSLIAEIADAGVAA